MLNYLSDRFNVFVLFVDLVRFLTKAFRFHINERIISSVTKLIRGFEVKEAHRYWMYRFVMPVACDQLHRIQRSLHIPKIVTALYTQYSQQ